MHAVQASGVFGDRAAVSLIRQHAGAQASPSAKQAAAEAKAAPRAAAQMAVRSFDTTRLAADVVPGPVRSM